MNHHGLFIMIHHGHIVVIQRSHVVMIIPWKKSSSLRRRNELSYSLPRSPERFIG